MYEDENIVVAYKWQGILSNNESNEKLNEPTFEELVKKDLKDENIILCHRLDRNTSGLLIFAKTKDIFNEVVKAFENFEIEKHYLAYVNNSKFKNSHDIMEAYIVKDKTNGFSKVYNNKVKNSEKIITEYSVLSKNSNLDFAILDVTLHTGKTHQIRSHLSFIGHEIIGDSKYGKNEVNKKFKKNRQLLIAYKYIFNINGSSKLAYLNKKEITLKKEEILNII
ncbi:MAG: RluA family pseudouridine synthase [Clostridia bacterium]|nr:RluA family pseudouridine synthase [Clostridia bacterium]